MPIPSRRATNCFPWRGFPAPLRACSRQTGLCKYEFCPLKTAGRLSFHRVRPDESINLCGAQCRRKLTMRCCCPRGEVFRYSEVVTEQAISRSEFLQQHGEWKVTRFENTAAAARFVAQSGRKDIAAIASRRKLSFMICTLSGKRKTKATTSPASLHCHDMQIYPVPIKLFNADVANLPGACSS